MKRRNATSGISACSTIRSFGDKSTYIGARSNAPPPQQGHGRLLVAPFFEASMRRAIALSAATLLTGIALLAQGGAGGPAVQPPTCPASGYGAQGYYGMFAQNEDGFTAYEIASPCIGKDVREVAESIGMGRGKV